MGEIYTNGTLAGLTITNLYNSYLQRTQNAAKKTDGTVLASASYAYDTAARLTNATDGTYSAAYTYLANSPLINQITFQQSGSTKMTTTRQYDYLNRLLAISSTPSAAGLMPLSHEYQYNDGNQRTRITLSDGSFWVYEYDPLGQVKSGKRYWSDNTPVAGQQFEYAFDEIGNRTSTKAGGDAFGSSSALRSATYTPNNLNQYSSRTVPDKVDLLGIANASASVTVNSSSADYRRAEYFQELLSVNNGSASQWPGVTNIADLGGTKATNSGNVFVPKTAENFIYDRDGNLLSDGRWTNKWDAENRLIQMVSLSGAPSGSERRVSFTYDFAGRRIAKGAEIWTNSAWSVVLSNKFLYDGWNLVAELNGTNNAVIRSYLWGLDLSDTQQGAGGVGGLLAVNISGSGIQFAAFDGNGNVGGLYDVATTNWSAKYEYGPFGELIRATGPMAKGNAFRFSTKYQDDETDFLYYGFRFYNSSTGRWLSRDPIEERGGLNVYGYVGNQPVCQIDPLGLRIYIVAPNVGDLDYTHFDDYVLSGFQRIIGDCAKLHKDPIIVEEEVRFIWWTRKTGKKRLVGWQIYYTDEKPNCVCKPCWKTLKGALGVSLPPRHIYISRPWDRFQHGPLTDYLSNASESRGVVTIFEGISSVLPEVGSDGSIVRNPAPFEVVLWHEAIGHGYLDLGPHADEPWNRRGGGGQDPIILEENNARNCLRLQGIQINDRVPTYYGWKDR